MPQDSTYVILDNGDTFYLQQGQSNSGVQSSDGNQETQVTGGYYTFIVMLGFVVGLLALKKLFRGDNGNETKKDIFKLPYSVGDAKWLQYHQLLLQKNPYYLKLNKELQGKFLYRVSHFMNGKKFVFMELKPSEEIVVLISAAAIQISFGLEEFEMNYFKNIYVLRTNYHFGFSPVPYEGHVSSMGIYISWNNFERSFQDYSDGNNLGLHEMAHALAYVNFTARVGEDDYFRKRFKLFSKVGRLLLKEMQEGKNNMLGNYAATNYNEFWAVCVENFFERPDLLKKDLPELYFELVMLLQQDPTLDNLLINREKTA